MLTALSELTVLAAALPISFAVLGGGVGGTVGVLGGKSGTAAFTRTRCAALQGAHIGLVGGAIVVLAGLLLSALGVAISVPLPQ